MDLHLAALPITNASVLCVGGITALEAENLRSDGYQTDGLGYYLFLANEGEMGMPIRVLARFYSAAEAEACAFALRQRGAETSN